MYFVFKYFSKAFRTALVVTWPKRCVSLPSVGHGVDLSSDGRSDRSVEIFMKFNGGHFRSTWTTEVLRLRVKHKNIVTRKTENIRHLLEIYGKSKSYLSTKYSLSEEDDDNTSTYPVSTARAFPPSSWQVVVPNYAAIGKQYKQRTQRGVNPPDGLGMLNN